MLVNKYTFRLDYEVNKKENKVFLNNLLNLFFLIVFITLFAIGYQAKYKNCSELPLSNGIKDNNLEDYYDSLAQPLPEWVRTIRGISLFFLGWYLFFSFRSLWLSKKFYNEDKLRFVLCVFSFIPIFNIWLLIDIMLKNHCDGFIDYIKSWFSNDDYYYGIKYEHDLKYWLIVLFLILSSPILWFALFRDKELSNISINTGYANNLWFSSFQYFTVETNLLCFITLLVYVLFPKWKLFKNNYIIILMSSYITIVCLIFNLAIVPFNVDTYANHPYKIARTVVEHGINPVLFVASFILIMIKDNFKIGSFKQMNLRGLVIPSVYGVYATISPLACGVSVYSFITNTNPDLISGGLHGHYATFLIVIAFALLFSLFNFIYYLVNKKINNSYATKYFI